MSTRPDPTRRGANAARSRDHNRQLVMAQVQAGGALGRAELARRSGLTTQAVSNIIADLEADGLLQPAGAARGRRGLPAIQYAVNPAGAYALGVELRPGALLASVLDLAGDTVWQDRVAVASAAPDAVPAPLRGLRDAALAALPGGKAARLLGAGIAMPGPFGRTALSGQATDLPGWQDVGRRPFPVGHPEPGRGVRKRRQRGHHGGADRPGPARDRDVRLPVFRHRAGHGHRAGRAAGRGGAWQCGRDRADPHPSGRVGGAAGILPVARVGGTAHGRLGQARDPVAGPDRVARCGSPRR